MAAAGSVAGAATTVKAADALTVPAAAWTSRTGWVVCGMTTAAVKYPEALTLNAAEPVPAVRVPELFFGKPVPVTVTVVPAGPWAGLRLMDAEAACAGTAASDRLRTTSARTHARLLIGFIGTPRPDAGYGGAS